SARSSFSRSLRTCSRSCCKVSVCIHFFSRDASLSITLCPLGCLGIARPPFKNCSFLYSLEAGSKVAVLLGFVAASFVTVFCMAEGGRGEDRLGSPEGARKFEMALGELVEFVKECIREPILLLALLKSRGHLGCDHVEADAQRSGAAGNTTKVRLWTGWGWVAARMDGLIRAA